MYNKARIRKLISRNQVRKVVEGSSKVISLINLGIPIKQNYINIERSEVHKKFFNSHKNIMKNK